MDEVNKRIIEFMVKSGHSKSTFARELDVSLPLITHITTGRNKPGLDLIQKLLLTFPELNPDWLLNGINEMYRSTAKSIDLSAELAKLNQLKDLLNSPLNSINTVMGYHKLLVDELLHLQELDLELGNSSGDLTKVSHSIEAIKRDIQLKVED